MLFNSLQYLFFLPLVVILYYTINYRYRWVLLLGASYYFYMCWKPEYVILILISTVVDYYAAIKIDSANNTKKKKSFLALSLMTNLGLLFSFKYFNFFSRSFTEALEKLNIFYEAPLFQVLLPVGISFYTFQTLSYTIDVYRGERRAEQHFGIFAVFVSFFPQLVAGPIERSSNLIPQLRSKIILKYENISSGIKIFSGDFL